MPGQSAPVARSRAMHQDTLAGPVYIPTILSTEGGHCQAQGKGLSGSFTSQIEMKATLSLT